MPRQVECRAHNGAHFSVSLNLNRFSLNIFIHVILGITQEHARQLLQLLADGNPKFEVQVYKGLIALLPASNPRTQQMALQALRFVQPIVKNANQALVEPLLDVLKTQHLEVQYEGT